MTTTTQRAATSLHGLLNGCLFGGLLVAVAWCGAQQAKPVVDMPPTYHQRVQPTATHGHHCWSGEAPASEQGKLPAGVVVSHDGGPQQYEDSPQAVGAALDHVFDGSHPNLTVYAFCAG